MKSQVLLLSAIALIVSGCSQATPPAATPTPTTPTTAATAPPATSPKSDAPAASHEGEKKHEAGESSEPNAHEGPRS